MALDKNFLDRDTNISAKVIADSIADNGKRITTFELEYNRFVHAELMTHRDLSRNSSSSRAIPTKRMIETTGNNMAMPTYFGKNQSGMQAREEIKSVGLAKNIWKQAFENMVESTEMLSDLGLHKQIPNRLLESFQMIKVVVTATNFDNFYNLRVHKDAQPEILLLAHKMYEAQEQSYPKFLRKGEWHLPYVEISQGEDVSDTYYYTIDVDASETETDGYEYRTTLSLDEAIKISAASCAAVSYRTEGMTLERADKIFDMLIKAEVLHSSPFEHLGTPIANESQAFKPETWQEGVTHVRKDGTLCSGNLSGWVQYRHLLNHNTCEDFKYQARKEDF